MPAPTIKYDVVYGGWRTYYEPESNIGGNGDDDEDNEEEENDDDDDDEEEDEEFSMEEDKSENTKTEESANKEELKITITEVDNNFVVEAERRYTPERRDHQVNDNLLIKDDRKYQPVIEKKAKTKTRVRTARNTAKDHQKKRPGNHVITPSAYISPERLKQLKKIVDKAAQHQKTFTIFGRYPSVVEALKSRGWIQNFDLGRLTLPKQRHYDDDVTVFAKLQSTDETERLVISRMLRNTAVNFIWATSENIDWNNLSKNTLISRFPRVYFTTKVGICSYLQQSHWFFENGIAYTRFPRCYIISCNDDVRAFVRDFRLTACTGMLKRVIRALELGHASIFFSDNGKIPLRAIEFAVKRCSEFVSSEEHEDIDRDTEEKIWDHQWDQYLTYYYQLVHERETFVSATEDQIKEINDCSKTTLETLRKYCPQMDMDGTNNLWIVKPGAKSRGRGIVLLTKLEDIVHRVSAFSANEPRYVVQKYIEKPLLIHQTKFDIRQWFLVTCAYPLTIWMYKECYLRFCSQLFSLNNTHESIHLSNNAIQCKYKNAKRDGALPDENMWDCYTFQAYLRTIGKADRWESVIYPGMRQSITGALLAAQEHMEHRRNCFELYGADFMLTEDLVPWLIEINSSPCMSPTTSVTARLCAQCLEDVIKVVIDKRSNKDAETGMFELAYRQQVSPPQPYMGMNLTVRGCQIGRHVKSARNVKHEGVEKKTKDLDSPQVNEAIKRLSDQLSTQSTNTSSIPDTPVSSISIGTTTTSCVGTMTSSASSLGYSSEPKLNQKKRSYKRHCCISKTNASQAVTRYKMNKNYEHISRKINGSKSMSTVQIPQVNHLFDWRKRVEKTKETCQNIFTKFNNGEKTDDDNENINTADGKTNEKLPSVVNEKTNKRTLERKSPILNKLHRISSLPNIKRITSKEVNNNVPPLLTTYHFVKPITTRVT